MISETSHESRAKVATILAYLAAGVGVLSIIYDFLLLGVISGIQNGTAGLAEANSIDSKRAAVAILSLAAILAAVTAYLVWVNNVNKALRQTGLMGMKFTPGFAVGAYFIPFYNLVAGLQVMDELWKGSHATQSENAGVWNRRSTNPKVIAWWLTWIVSGIVGRLSVPAEGATVDQIRTSVYMAMLSTFVFLAATYFHTNALKEVTQALIRRIREWRQAARNPQPPPAPEFQTD